MRAKLPLSSQFIGIIKKIEMKWINIKDKLPELDTPVLIYDSIEDSVYKNRYFIAELITIPGEKRLLWFPVENPGDQSIYSPSHWAELPISPK